MEKEIEICSVCGEPLETIIPEALSFKGMNRHGRLCLCERTRREAEDRAREQREREDTIKRNRSICFTDKAMYNWCFEKDDGSVQAISYARKYVENFEKLMRDGTGLLFWGDVGTGKSFLAGCIANALLDKMYTVKMTNFTTIINDLFACEDKNAYVDWLMKYSLLIIDDLGAERCTEYATENVFNVIDRRCRSGLPLIITTNLTVDILKNETMVDRKRIYDRILERCVPILVNGQSKRADIAKDRMRLMQGL